MPDAILKSDGREVALENDVTTIGRATDNDVSYPEDSNVSRFHAEIERRGGDYWLIDLKSSNGTTVNGRKVEDAVRIEFGDKIVFGGSSEAEFGIANGDDGSSAAGKIPEPDDPKAEIGAYQGNIDVPHLSAADAIAAVPVAAQQSSSNPVLLIAGVTAGLAVVCVVAAGAFFITRGTSCSATASIVRPEAGDTISNPVEIQVRSENAGCIQTAVYTIDGQEVARADGPEFAATLDPKDLPELSDGLDHSLQVVLVDDKGQKLPQPGSVMLAFETRSVAKPSPTPAAANTNTGQAKVNTSGMPSLVQTSQMAQQFVKLFSGNFAYNVSNKQFLQEVQKRTSEFAQEGYWQRASTYRDTINVAFVREQNIDAPLGFILAMSRSKFIPTRQGDLEGLWQLSSSFVAENKYNGQCGAESLSDPLQNCAARSAALYTKALVYGVFDGDAIYSAAAFGKSPQDAAAWKASLPANRSNIWETIKTPAEREQIVRFFAAGIVSENPRAFGLAKDRPLSELYRVAM